MLTPKTTDILTKGYTTRGEWNNLLHLFIFSIFSSARTMSKRMQQGTGEERIVAKSKPTLNQVSRSAASSPTAPSSSASNRPVTLRAPSQQGSQLMAHCDGKPAAGGSNHNDAASSSQVWLTDSKLSERATVDTNQGQNCPESARKLAADFRVSRANVPHLENFYANL